MCNMLLLCVKTIMKMSHKFEIAHLKKKKMKEKHFGRLATFWFSTFAMLVLEILRNLFVLAYIVCPRYPYI